MKLPLLTLLAAMALGGCTDAPNYSAGRPRLRNYDDGFYMLADKIDSLRSSAPIDSTSPAGLKNIKMIPMKDVTCPVHFYASEFIGCPHQPAPIETLVVHDTVYECPDSVEVKWKITAPTGHICTPCQCPCCHWDTDTGRVIRPMILDNTGGTPHSK